MGKQAIKSPMVSKIYSRTYTLFMKHEAKPTTRLEWTQFRDHIQNDVNETLDDLSLEIEAANLYLAQLYADGRIDELEQFANEKVNELDERWKYSGDYFMVSGTWHNPTVQGSPHGVHVDHMRESVLQTAASNGFIVQAIEKGNDDEPVPQIGYSFLATNQALYLNSSFVQLGFQPLAFAELDAISLQYMRPGENAEVVSAELDEIFDRVARAESLIELYTNTPFSQFYDQSAKKQQAFFADMIQMIDDAMPAPDSLDALAAHITTRRVYKANVTDTYLRIDAHDASQDFELQGKVAGFLSLNQLPHDKIRRFAKPEDLVDNSASLLAIVQTYDQNFFEKNSFEPGTPLLVPLDDVVSLSARLI